MHDKCSVQLPKMLDKSEVLALLFALQHCQWGAVSAVTSQVIHTLYSITVVCSNKFKISGVILQFSILILKYQTIPTVEHFRLFYRTCDVSLSGFSVSLMNQVDRLEFSAFLKARELKIRTVETGPKMSWCTWLVEYSTWLDEHSSWWRPLFRAPEVSCSTVTN